MDCPQQVQHDTRPMQVTCMTCIYGPMTVAELLLLLLPHITPHSACSVHNLSPAPANFT